MKPDDGARTNGAGPYFYLLITMALFAGAFTSSKVVVGQVPHDVAAALRFGGGALILVLLLCLRRGTGKFVWRELAIAGSVGLVGVFAYNFFFFWAISLAPAIDGSIIVPVLSPVLTTIVFLVTGKESASILRVAGLVLGVVGAVVFFVGIGGSGAGLTGSRLLGDLIYLAGAACWAAYSIASKKVLAGMEPLRATTYATGAGALALILVSVPSLSHVDWTGLNGTIWANVAFLAIGPTAIAFLFYYRGLRSVSPVTATITMFIVPVLSSVSSYVFLGESFTGIQLVGALITIAGALLAVTRSRRSSGARPERAGRSRTRRSDTPQRVQPAADTGRTG